jgi:hypothetical protein
MKDDAPVPDEVPRKRRQLEDPGVVLDKWIAVWLARDDLMPSDRRRLEAEKARRKALKPECIVGLVASQEGMTPPQFVEVLKALRALTPTSVLHTRLSRRVHGTVVGLCESIGASHCLIADVRDEDAAAREVVREVDMLIAAPREATVQTYATPGIWSIIGLSRHRHVPVQVVLPSGELN